MKAPPHPVLGQGPDGSSLPLEPSSEIPNAVKDYGAERLRILVVDDDSSIREMLPAFLIEGYAPGPAPIIETVGSAEEVAARLARTSPNECLAVLSDYNLKTAKNGIDVLAEVQRARPDAIRILFSGHSREEIRGVNEADLHGFLEKPFRLDEIVQPFRAIVDRLATPRAGTTSAPAYAPTAGSSPRALAAGKLAPTEVMTALVKAATRGEGARAQTLYEEASRRGQGEEANRETNSVLTWQNRVLEMVATNAPLQETLTVLTRAIDEQAPGMLASVRLVNEGGTHLVYGAAPGLQDVSKEGWSTSIITPDGRLLGTFALSCHEPRAPTERELQMIDLGANLARVAIVSDGDRHERKRAEAELRDAHAQSAAERNKFHNLLMHAPSAMTIVEGPEHRFTFVNPKASDINGRDASELLGKTVAEAVPEVVEQGFIKLLDGVYTTGEPVFFSEMPITFKRAGKLEERVLDFSYQAYRGADGRIAGVTALANDVTTLVRARREAEAQVRALDTANAEIAAERNRFHNLLMTAPSTIVILEGPEHRYTFANPKTRDITGRDPSELIGKTLAEAFPEVVEQGFIKLLDGIYTTGKPVLLPEIPVTFQHADKLDEHFLDVSYQAYRGADGRIAGITAFTNDVTTLVRARQQVEAQVRALDAATAEVAAERNRFRDFFMGAPSVFNILEGPEHRYTFANPKTRDLIGRDPSEIIGKTVAEAFPEVVEQGFIKLLDGVYTTGEPVFLSQVPVALMVDGKLTERIHDISYQAYRGADGRIAGVTVISNDVTMLVRARQEVEAQVLARTAELAATNRELEAFNAAVSHDLRAPLRNINGLGKILERKHGGTLPEAAKVILGQMSEETIRMGKLIDSILSLAKLGSGAVAHADVDVSALATITLQSLQANDPERDVAWTVEPGLHAVGDDALLRVVIENLIGNAWKFTGRTEGARITVAREPGGFRVEDNGAGFDMTHARELFKPFRRLHKAEQFEGTGVGLATVNRIVTRHSGRVWAQATPGKGATFHVALPSTPLPKPPGSPTPAPPKNEVALV